MLIRLVNYACAKYHLMQNLRQVWFPGVHSNVILLTLAITLPPLTQSCMQIGGGYDDQGQANITLAWMISQLEPFLEFDPDYVLDQYEENRDYYKKVGQKPRPWSFGRYCRQNLNSPKSLGLLIACFCFLYHAGFNGLKQAKSTSP